MNELLKEKNMAAESINLKNMIDDFLKNFPKDDIYNEFSLQHELGIYLRNRLKGTQYKVQFERNSRDFFEKDTEVKHEIDIVVISRDKKEKFAAIELKYPKNGRYPEEMFDFCKDICFMEEVRCGGFKHAYCLILKMNFCIISPCASTGPKKEFLLDFSCDSTIFRR